MRLQKRKINILTKELQKIKLYIFMMFMFFILLISIVASYFWFTLTELLLVQEKNQKLLNLIVQNLYVQEKKSWYEYIMDNLCFNNSVTENLGFNILEIFSNRDVEELAILLLIVGASMFLGVGLTLIYQDQIQIQQLDVVAKQVSNIDNSTLFVDKFGTQIKIEYLDHFGTI